MEITNIYVLRPAKGKILYNGTDYSESVSAGSEEQLSQWREVPYEDYEAHLAALQAEYEAFRAVQNFALKAEDVPETEG